MIDLTELEREYDRFRKRAEEMYTPAVISNLAKEFSISDPSQIANLTTFLREAGKIYLIQRDAEKARLKLSPKKLKSQFEHINNEAATLKASLGSMSNAAQNLFWMPLRHTPIGIYLNSEPLNYFGYPVARYKNSAGAISTNIPNEVQAQNVIMLVANLAAFAIKRVKTDKVGRKSSEALWMWVSNMREFWTKGLNRKFTCYRNHADPVTEAHRFCFSALTPLDPPNVKLIGSIMREVIHNKGVKRDRPKKQKRAGKNR